MAIVPGSQSEEIGSIGQGLEKLLATSGGPALDRAQLIVALYELIQSEVAAVRDTSEKESQQASRLEVLSRLGRVLPTTELNPWRLPQRFWIELRQICRKHEPALAALAALQALDRSLQQVRDRRFAARRVTSSFFHRNSFWLSPQLALPWPERHSGKSPAGWLSFIRVIREKPEGARLQVLTLDSHLDSLLGSSPAARPGLGMESPLRIAVSPISRAIVTEAKPIERIFLNERPYSAYILEEQGEPDELLALLEKRVLPACVEHDAAVLLLPELTVGPTLRTKLALLLAQREADRAIQSPPSGPPRPVLVIAGSYHEKVGGDRYLNRSVVLDYRGKPATLRPAGQWIHDKVERYSFRKGVLGTKALKHWAGKLGLDAPGIEGAAEPPDLGTHFVLVETRIGRICVALCIDYFNRFGSFTDDVQGAWLDWIWVPSASTRLKEFEAIAGFLAPKGAATVVVNACWVPEAFRAWAGQWCGLAHLPGDIGRWIGAFAVGSEPAAASRTVPAAGCRLGCHHADDGCVFVLDATGETMTR